MFFVKPKNIHCRPRKHSPAYKVFCSSIHTKHCSLYLYKHETYTEKNRPQFPRVFEIGLSGSILAVYFACNHLPILKIFSHFVHFCPNFQIFYPFSEKSYPFPYFLE